MQANIPTVRCGVVAVSRNCFPISLSKRRREALVKAYAPYGELVEISTIIESEHDTLKALAELKEKNVNALVVYLGNFGPETPETLLAQKFDGPVMFAAAAEEDIAVLSADRGDALCGMLNASYNLSLRKRRVYIPAYPVGTAEEVAEMIHGFIPMARVILGLMGLKVITFGPRPDDFLACNAPIKPLYDLGIAVEENSELDLYAAFKQHANDARIPAVVEDMCMELGTGNHHPGILPRLAQLELTLLDWAEAHKGASQYVCFANKCWPAFQTEFGCVPCYVNSRLTARLMPVSCEVDIYGAISEYMICCATESAPTLLDINNSVPKEMFDASIRPLNTYKPTDVFMGFHCGNTASCRLKKPDMRHQLIMKRSLEPDTEPDITRGTLEGTIQEGDITLFRLQGAADCSLRAYVAQGEVLDVNPQSFGGIGVIAIPEMGRFYRQVMIGKQFPHHGAIAFGSVGRVLYDVLDYLGITDISYNRPKGVLYPNENPFN